MECKTIIDSFYDDEEISYFFRLRRSLHLLLCSSCAHEVHKLDIACTLMHHDFMPPSPDVGDLVMDILREDEDAGIETNQRMVPLRGWIIVGFFMLLALTSAYFGGDFLPEAGANGLSFLIPLGITIGALVIAYGALFVGTHLDMLCKKFGIGGH
ncbi:MAG: peptidoglycan-binding protein [Spirochaetaceae bacterium]|jgi:hypothetical protein|nr:peptidoglycan-binding protein [Spirochaetaceae bacterium]